MRVTISWLRDFVDFDLATEDLCRGLTHLGLEVEAVYPEGEGESGDELVQLARSEGFELDDTVIDFEVTPNRPDCLSIMGIAREVSILSGRPLKQEHVTLSESGRAVETAAELEVLSVDACPRYMGRVLTGIESRESPAWVKRRLLAVGLRPVSNVVDVANYVMLETGQPMHCFDLAKLRGQKVLVRFAKPGERILTLDDEEVELQASDLVIADSEVPVAIAGIIGGQGSAISKSTVSVFLECAVFDAHQIHSTQRRLALTTDASYRFERGVDICASEWACRRATNMLMQLCGGTLLAGSLESYPNPPKARAVRLRPWRIERILGVDIGAFAIEKTLLSLGFTTAREKDDRNREQFWVEPPSFRADVTIEEDLVEEIARVYGYGKIAPTLPTTRMSGGRLNPEVRLQREVRALLCSLGLCEAWTLSLSGEDVLTKCRIPEDHVLRSGVKLLNPLSADQNMLRTFLLPGLLTVASHNSRHKTLDRWLFSLGSVFSGREEARPEERTQLCILACGDFAQTNWARRQEKASFYHLKGLLERIIDMLRLGGSSLEPRRLPYAAETECCEVRVASESIGNLGKLHPEVADSFDLPADCYFAELDLQSLSSVDGRAKEYEPFPHFPAVVLDLAITIEKGARHSEVEAIIRELGGDLIDDIVLFDRYEGKQIPRDRIGLAYSISYRASDRTLMVSEAFKQHQRIIDSLSKRLGAVLRQ